IDIAYRALFPASREASRWKENQISSRGRSQRSCHLPTCWVKVANETNENKIDRERRRAGKGASAQNEWQKRDGGQHEKEAQNWGGAWATRGGKANQDATWAEPNTKLEKRSERQTTRTKSGRKQELQKKGTRNRNKNKISMVHSS
ncbi:hypothetical protein TNCV_4857781, partial [Trichonephila clavipes]